MIKVSNRKCIRQLSWKSMKASKTRNLIAIFAIILTTVLFTTLFTIVLSLNEGIQQHNFRQVGGCAHGTFKYLTEEEFDNLKEDALIKNWGLRRFVGVPMETPFHKTYVEVSYTDANSAQWMYCNPVEGSYPVESTNEAATDLYVLDLMGVEPVIGNEFTITFDVNGIETTQTFTLCGWWEHDEASLAHHILIPESRLESILAEVDVEPENRTDGYTGTTGTWNLDVMFDSSMHIESNMRKVLANHGYQPEGVSGAESTIAYGVNWGYTGAQLAGNADSVTTIAIIAVLLLIFLTGYLIIYNVFQTSVTNDIRFYGLLKTIGTTPKQLKRMIRNQAICLSFVGIPIGLLIGWLVGYVLTPIVIMELNGVYNVVSVSPIIFVIASVFSLITIVLSCNRPGKIAAKVSPIEAVRYTERKNSKQVKKKSFKKLSMFSLAKANLGRNTGKTMVTMLSMSLAVVLLTVTVTFTAGFDMNKYLSARTVTDFVVANAGYFQLGSTFTHEKQLAKSVIDEITAQKGIVDGGCVYGTTISVNEFLTEAYARSYYNKWTTPENANLIISQMERTENNMLLEGAQLYGMESFVLNQLEVIEGDISELYNPGSRAIAAVYLEDDYGNPHMDSHWAQIGDTVTLRYTDEWEYYYTDNGEIIEEFSELVTNGNRPWSQRSKVYQDMEYEVVALVSIPHALSYRYIESDGFVLNDQTFIQDTETNAVMLYTFNTMNETTAAMEKFICNYTEKVDSSYGYESKATYVKEFESFRTMILLLGSVLSFIIGFVGILNFFNAVLTSIVARRREFAVIQSIGMTGKQLKQMLICEGLFYALGSIVLSLGFILVLSPLIASGFTDMFWFFTYKFTLSPIFIVTPVFSLLGWLIPMGVYQTVSRATIVERLRETEN